MFVAIVDRNSIQVQGEELITSGSVKTNFVQFKFSDDWTGLTKTAIFQTKKVSIPVIVDGEDKVAIPWEAMAFPKEEIKFGVYGVRFDDGATENVDEEIVLPTIWGSLGKVVEGVLVESPPITAPTKDAYLQLLDYIKGLQPGGGESTDKRISDGSIFIGTMDSEPTIGSPYSFTFADFVGLKPSDTASYTGLLRVDTNFYISTVTVSSVDEKTESVQVKFDSLKKLTGWEDTTGGMPYVDLLVAPHETYSSHNYETLLDQSLYYLTDSGDPAKVFGTIEVGKEFSAYFLYDGEQLNPTLKYFGVFICDEYEALESRIKATLKSATFVGNKTETLNSFLTFFKLDAVPEANTTIKIPFTSAIGLMPQWQNVAHQGLMRVNDKLYLIDFRLEWIRHDTEEFEITVNAIYPISNSGANGVTFTPSVSSEGVISFTNDGGLENPEPVNIKGPTGNTGDDALVYEQILTWSNVPDDGDPAPVNVYSFTDPQGHYFNRPPKVDETWTGVMVYYSDVDNTKTKDVFVATFRVASVTEEGYYNLLIDKKSVMPTIAINEPGSTEDSFVTIKDKTISTPTDLRTALGKDFHIGCVHFINSTIGETTFENDIVWMSFTATLDTYYLTVITIDGYVEELKATGESGPFSTTNTTTFIREDRLDLAKGTYFVGSWTEAPMVNNEYVVGPASFIGKKPSVSQQYMGIVRHDSANILYDVSAEIKNIVDAAITVKIVRSKAISSQSEETTITPGDGLTITDGVASVDTPVRNILTQAEYDALPEDKQSKGMYVIKDAGSTGDSGSASGGNNIKMPLIVLLAAGWDEKGVQTITLQGILSDESAQIIRPTPAIASQELYYSSGILCTNQAENSLTFTASDIPASDLLVYVEIQEVA